MAATNVNTLVASDADGVRVGSKKVATRIQVVKSVNANASLVTECVFICDRAYNLGAVSESHSTAGSDASAVSIQITKDTGTTAPGGGTAILTNNTNAGFNAKGTANTVQTGTFAATAFAAGDRISIKYTGTLTALAGVCVAIGLEPA